MGDGVALPLPHDIRFRTFICHGTCMLSILVRGFSLSCDDGLLRHEKFNTQSCDAIIIHCHQIVRVHFLKFIGKRWIMVYARLYFASFAVMQFVAHASQTSTVWLLYSPMAAMARTNSNI